MLLISLHQHLRFSHVRLIDFRGSIWSKISVSVILYCSQDSSVGTVTWLPGRSGNRGSIPGRGKSFFSSPQQSEREVDQPLSDARVKNEQSLTFLWKNLRLPQEDTECLDNAAANVSGVPAEDYQ
jgi:hypothetical protein